MTTGMVARARLSVIRFAIGLVIALGVLWFGTMPSFGSEPVDHVGLVNTATGEWHLRAPDGTENSFYFGNPGDVPFMGDWDCDGLATPGLFRITDAYAYLSNANRSQIADIRFYFGNPSDLPLAGDFNGDGCDTLSLYRPSEQRFYIINRLGKNEGGLGAADYSFVFGNPGDKPVIGDWDGDGIDEVGLHRESSGYFYYRNTLDTGIAHGEFYFGNPDDRFVAGDWGVVDGVETPAVFRPGNTTFYFRHTNTPGVADSELTWGETEWLPVAWRRAVNAADEATLATYAAATWRSIEELVSPIGLPADHRSESFTAGYTKPTDIAAYLWSTVAASDLGVIAPGEASDRIDTTLGTLRAIDRHWPSGLFYNTYDVATGAALPESASGLFVSTVDNAWLAVSLTIVGNAFPVHAPAADLILDTMDFAFLYNDAEQLFYGGWWADLDTPTAYTNGTLNSETRIASYLAIARGEVPASHYYRLGRTLDWCDDLEMEPVGEIRTHLGVDVLEGHYTYRDPGADPRFDPIELVPSWGGSMFEAMMPTLFVPEEEWGPLSWNITHPRYVKAQITHGLHDAQYGYWGFSPAASPSAAGYDYRTYGVDAIGMWGDGYPSDDANTFVDYGYPTCEGRDPLPFPAPGDYGGGVVTPHAAFLALDFAPGLALDNLRALEDDFAVFGQAGFYDSVNVSTGEVAAFHLPLDQGMVMASIANFLLDNRLQAHFVTPEFEAAVTPLLAAEEFWP